MSFKKYIKYKNKYLTLKKLIQSAGNNNLLINKNISPENKNIIYKKLLTHVWNILIKLFKCILLSGLKQS